MSDFMMALGSTGSWAPLALSVSWQLALFALLAWAIERVLRQPRPRYALWWFVLLAPLVLTPLRAHLAARQALVAVPAPPALARVTAVSVAPVVAPPTEAPSRAPIVPLTPPKPSWCPQALALLKKLWLLGALALLLRLLIGYRQIGLLVRGSRRVADDSVLAMLRDLCARAGVRSLELRASADVTAAVLCGVRRPVILVPEEWLSELSPEELRALLAHEVAHVRRRDVAANLAQRVLEAFLSLHPGTWLVSRRITTAREEACDAWAIGQGADPAEYARCLARAAARAQARFTVASVGIAEGKSRLRQRVEAVMRLGSMGAVSRRVVIAVVTVLVLCAIGFAAVRMTEPEQPGSSATQTTEPAAPAEATPQADRALLDLTVVLPDGKPAAGATLTVEGPLPWQGPVWRGETDAQGKATIVIEHPEPHKRLPLRISYAGPSPAGRGLPATVALMLSPGTRTSATVTVPRGVRRIESAPRNAEEAADRAQRDAAWAAVQARFEAKQAEEKEYWRRRRAEVAAMPAPARRAEAAKVQARLHQLKAKAHPLDAQVAALDKAEQAVINRLREIEATSPGTQTPEAMALKEKFNRLLAERSGVTRQQEQLLDQRRKAETELTVLQQAGDA